MISDDSRWPLIAPDGPRCSQMVADGCIICLRELLLANLVFRTAIFEILSWTCCGFQIPCALEQEVSLQSRRKMTRCCWGEFGRARGICISKTGVTHMPGNHAKPTKNRLHSAAQMGPNCPHERHGPHLGTVSKCYQDVLVDVESPRQKFPQNPMGTNAWTLC